MSVKLNSTTFAKVTMLWPIAVVRFIALLNDYAMLWPIAVVWFIAYIFDYRWYEI